MIENILFNIKAKDLENAKEVSLISPMRILINIPVKQYETDQAAADIVNLYKENAILTSVGLGANDSDMWSRVIQVAKLTNPFHINQVYPAAGYTMGKMFHSKTRGFIINATIEPSDDPKYVYIQTGSISKKFKEKVSCDLAASLLADVGLNSIKFYPTDGTKKLENMRNMVKAGKKFGIQIFEPTGGIDMQNAHEIVKTCLDEGAQLVIPHIHTALICEKTGKTKVEYVQKLVDMKW